MKPKQKCKSCNHGYKTLTDEKLCYQCHFNKYGVPPKTGAYKEGK